MTLMSADTQWIVVGRAQVAPSVPCTLITPIAPHTLSFRPVVVPEASDIVIHLSESSRAHARRARHALHAARPC